MEQETKTNTQKLKELQVVAEEYLKLEEEVKTIVEKTKKEVNLILEVMDDLELKYNILVREIQNNK